MVLEIEPMDGRPGARPVRMGRGTGLGDLLPRTASPAAHFEFHGRDQRAMGPRILDPRWHPRRGGLPPSPSRRAWRSAG